MTTQLMRPRTVLIIECRTCQKPWTYHEIDTDGNGPCCRQLSPGQVFDLEINRIQARLHAKDEEIRVLKLANKSFARMAALRPQVLRFAELMEERLKANDHKGGWSHDYASVLLKRLREETEELDDALLPDGSPELIGREAADVANFAMMIADVCGALAAVEESK